MQMLVFLEIAVMARVVSSGLLRHSGNGREACAQSEPHTLSCNSLEACKSLRIDTNTSNGHIERLTPAPDGNCILDKGTYLQVQGLAPIG